MKLTQANKWFRPFLGFFLLVSLFISPVLPAKADEQTTLQESAKRIERLYEEGKITEQQALAELKNIEKLAIAYRKDSSRQLSAEEATGSILMRKAAFPSFSVFGLLLRYIAPTLLIVLVIGLVVSFYGSSFGLNRMADWLARKRHQLYQSVHDLVSPVHGNAPEVPVTPRAAPRTSGNHAPPHPSPGNRHSGEVPDHLA